MNGFKYQMVLWQELTATIIGRTTDGDGLFWGE